MRRGSQVVHSDTGNPATFKGHPPSKLRKRQSFANADRWSILFRQITPLTRASQTMMNPFKVLTMPEYFFRPSQILTRLRRSLTGIPHSDQVTLPWGDVITVRPHEVIGAGIWYYGIFDLPVTEAICRLLERGETALDIGANIGQMTSLLRVTTGVSGRVLSFEPHPELFSEMSTLVAQRHVNDVAPVDRHQVALGEVEGEAQLEVPGYWANNRGIAKLSSSAANGSTSIRVKVTTLDRVLSPATQVGVCKIDVEGHELSVFKGAAQVFAERRIRDIIYEDFQPYPSPVHSHLKAAGFTLFHLDLRLLGPCLTEVDTKGAQPQPGKEGGANYLATLCPDRALALFKPGGWKVFRMRRR
jgi:FkbM family methyltransferase